MPKRRIFVGHGKTAAPAGSALGTGNRRGGGGVRGKWWNPPKASPVKELDQITKENEEKAKPRKEKSRSDARTRVGGGSPSSHLVRGLLKTPRR